MKYVICLLLALEASVFSFAQDAKLSGRIIHPLSNTVAVSYFDNLITYEPRRISTLLDKNGRFTISVPVAGKYTQVTYTNGSQETELFLSPAMS